MNVGARQLGEETFDVKRAVRQAPSTELLEWLGDMGEREWRELLDALQPMTNGVARRFPEFDDVEGRLGEGCVAGLGKEGQAQTPWVHAYLESATPGSGKTLSQFLENKLRDHLKAQRIKERSRKAKLEALEGGAASPAGMLGQQGPDEALDKRELMKQAATISSPEDELFVRAVLTLKEGGFNGAEISQLLGVSQAKVSRSVGRVANLGEGPSKGSSNPARFLQALLAALVICLVLYSAYRLRSDRAAIHQEQLTADPSIEPAEELPAAQPEEETLEVEPEPEAPPEVEAPAPAPARAPRSTLEINTTPWAHVYVDGEDTGLVTPVSGFAVDPGEHQVRLVTPAGVERTVSVDVARGETERVMLRLDAPE